METEITVQVFMKAEDVKEYLLKNGFEILEIYDINDNYYSKYRLSKLKKMSYKSLIKNSFLLREIVDDNPRCQLCYKDKIIKNDVVIAETKYTSQVVNKNDAEKVFEMSGLNLWCKSYNHTFSMKKDDIFLAVQDIKGLGCFIEYEEDESMNGMSPMQKIEYMKGILNGLGLPLGKDYNVKKVYMLFKKNM